ncbi:MAG: hypothetical protein NZ898_15950 [Myxococcota bacterium]|nr:hypothetical protein [Myxococcota bacterium]MDW8362453.1 hypothetical protein [Myxococcales bacterium]
MLPGPVERQLRATLSTLGQAMRSAERGQARWLESFAMALLASLSRALDEAPDGAIELRVTPTERFVRDPRLTGPSRERTVLGQLYALGARTARLERGITATEKRQFVALLATHAAALLAAGDDPVAWLDGGEPRMCARRPSGSTRRPTCSPASRSRRRGCVIALSTRPWSRARGSTPTRFSRSKHTRNPP